MKTWKVPITWEMAGTVDIVANSLKEAMALAKKMDGDSPVPEDARYLEGSMSLLSPDVETVRLLFNGLKED